MKAQIRIIGIGHSGCRLLDGMMACGLREELDTDESPTIAEIRYIAVETNIDTLGCSSADVGFYVGRGFGTDSEPEVIERMAAQTADIVEHVIHGAHLILLLTGLDDPLECMAAAALAELGQDKNILTLSLVSLPPVEVPRWNTAPNRVADAARRLRVYQQCGRAVPEGRVFRNAGLRVPWLHSPPAVPVVAVRVTDLARRGGSPARRCRRLSA